MRTASSCRYLAVPAFNSNLVKYSSNVSFPCRRCRRSFAAFILRLGSSKASLILVRKLLYVPRIKCPLCVCSFFQFRSQSEAVHGDPSSAPR